MDAVFVSRSLTLYSITCTAYRGQTLNPFIQSLFFGAMVPRQERGNELLPKRRNPEESRESKEKRKERRRKKPQREN
jgi:hypothetical protein